MNKSFLRAQSRRFLRFLMKNKMTELNESDIGRSAVVFAPHPDDETLGCGGTIIKKKRSDAKIKIVVATDGTRSHSTFIPKEQLKSMRSQEALAACHVLGIEKNDVIFLEFENGKLFDNFQIALSKVKEILVNLQPEEIFIPFSKEPSFWSEDHLATNRVVLSALKLSGVKTIVNEYPIGFWCHWPWTSLISQGQLNGSLSAWETYFFSGFDMLKDFQYFVCIKDVLEIKRSALNQYASQMKRLFSNPRQPILEDVSKGEFLKCFFQEREIFRRYLFSVREME
jgi:LmbE family N-acetylglucosaminyl deacetylase